MNRYSEVSSMVIILTVGVEPGAPAGLTGPVADFQP